MFFALQLDRGSIMQALSDNMLNDLVLLQIGCKFLAPFNVHEHARGPITAKLRPPALQSTPQSAPIQLTRY